MKSTKFRFQNSKFSVQQKGFHSIPAQFCSTLFCAVPKSEFCHDASSCIALDKGSCKQTPIGQLLIHPLQIINIITIAVIIMILQFISVSMV